MISYNEYTHGMGAGTPLRSQGRIGDLNAGWQSVLQRFSELYRQEFCGRSSIWSWSIVVAASAWSFLKALITVHMLGCWWPMRERKELSQPSQMLLVLSPRVIVDSKAFHAAGGRQEDRH